MSNPVEHAVDERWSLRSREPVRQLHRFIDDDLGRFLSQSQLVSSQAENIPFDGTDPTQPPIVGRSLRLSIQALRRVYDSGRQGLGAIEYQRIGASEPG